jgi:hypothetical protein
MNQEYGAETLFSFSEALPTPDERRTGPRYTTLLRVGTLETGAGKELCLIRNISAGGLMAHIYSDIPAGTRAHVELKSGQQVSGTIIWSRNSNIGLQFDTGIDVGELLTSCSSERRPRLPRIELDCFASVRIGARIYRGRACDISQGGVKVKLDAPIPCGEAVVTMSGFRSIAGAVRWCEGGLAGISFNQVIPLGELIPWLKESEKACLSQGMRRPLESSIAA